MRELETAVFLENHTAYFATIKTFATFIFRKNTINKDKRKESKQFVFILQRYLRKCRLSILKNR